MIFKEQVNMQKFIISCNYFENSNKIILGCWLWGYGVWLWGVGVHERTAHPEIRKNPVN